MMLWRRIWQRRSFRTAMVGPLALSFVVILMRNYQKTESLMPKGQRWPPPFQARPESCIEDATVKRFYYESHDQLRTHLADFVAAYNFARRLKTLRVSCPTSSSARRGRNRARISSYRGVATFQDHDLIRLARLLDMAPPSCWLAARSRRD